MSFYNHSKEDKSNKSSKSNKKDKYKKSKKDNEDKKVETKTKTETKIKTENVHGEFINTFTFGDRKVQLPIVQPGGHLVFPFPTVRPVGIEYVTDEKGNAALIAPRGVYNVSLAFNTPKGSEISFLVNGRNPRIVNNNTSTGDSDGESKRGYPYARTV